MDKPQRFHQYLIVSDDGLQVSDCVVVKAHTTHEIRTVAHLRDAIIDGIERVAANDSDLQEVMDWAGEDFNLGDLLQCPDGTIASIAATQSDIVDLAIESIGITGINLDWKFDTILRK